MFVVLAAVALFSAGLYLPATRYKFVWDDESLIVGNTLLERTRPSEVFARGFWAGCAEPVTGPAATYYRPLVTLSFWLDRKLSGADPQWFHSTNLVLYALASVAVTLVIWELLHSGVWALLGGLLFAAHSSHVESVAFVSGRTDTMLALFIALAAFALLRSFRRHSRGWWFVVPPAFGLALLSKETAVLFPLLVVLAPLLVGFRYERLYWLLVVVTLLVLAGYLLLRAGVVPMPEPLAGIGFWARASAVANTFGLYLGMFFWPFEHHAKYPGTDRFLVPTPNVIAALLFIVSVPLLALRRRFAATLWGYVWTILFLLPVANLISIGALAAERLLFLPSAGLVMVLVTVLSRLLTFRHRARQVVGVALGLVVLVLGADSRVRQRVWQSPETLFTAMIREAPTAPSAYANLADAISLERPDSALTLYNQALRLDQGFVQARVHIAVLLSQKGDHRRALHHLRLANDLRPNSLSVLNNLGLAFLAAGEPDSALATFDRALAAEPGSGLARMNRASALLTAGREAEALAEFRQALALDSSLAPAGITLADRLRQRGRYDSAIVLMRVVVRAQPSAVGFNQMGSMFVSAGDSTRAEECYSQALQLDSGYVPALYNQSVLSAARGDSAAARALAQRAYRLRPDLVAVKELLRQLSPDSLSGDRPFRP